MKTVVLRIRWVLTACLGLYVFCGCGPTKPTETNRELLVWHVEPTQESRVVLDKIARGLEKEHPGLTVTVENKPWLTLGADLSSAIAQGRRPDLSMVEPYMMSSLVSQKLIEPLDDLYAELGNDDFYSFLRSINTFDGRLYGIPHAYGVGYYAVRKDLLSKVGKQSPRTWADLLSLAQDFKQFYEHPVLLCGGTDFLLDQLFVNLVSSDGGKLFDPQSNRPLFTSPAVIESLEFFDRLKQFAPPDWKTRTYQDTFITFARGNAAIVPMTAARTINQIAKDAPTEIADPEHFGVFHTPVGPSGKQAFTFIDAEPWVIFSASKSKDTAREFLRKFYANKTYMDFCLTVPLHLTPTRKSLHDEYFNHDFLKKWHSWADLQLELIESEKVLPLMSSSQEDHRLPFLWEVFQSRVVTQMLAGDGPAAERAATAQNKAEKLIEQLGYKKWH